MKKLLKEAKALFTKRTSRYSIGTLLVWGLVVGILLTNGTTAVMNATSSEAFCTSCHEMEANAFAEYKTTTHYLNSSGVQVECADCHVPSHTLGKVARKIEGPSGVVRQSHR